MKKEELEKFTKNELLILKYSIKIFKSIYSKIFRADELIAINTIVRSIDNLVLYKNFKK